MKFMADIDFYKRVRLHSPHAYAMLRKAAMKTASSSYRYLHVLVKIAEEYGITVDRWGAVKHWTSCRGASSVPLAVVVECCRILGENVLGHVPVQFAPLLRLHGVMSYRRLVALRGVQPALSLDEISVRCIKTRATDALPHPCSSDVGCLSRSKP